jgi:hypothetical protein
MKCDEIQERFVDLLYDEPGLTPADPEVEAHIRDCPKCRRELTELGTARKLLKAWKDEPPLKPVQVESRVKPFFVPRFTAARIVRYAAVAAMAVLAFLALANAELTWNSEEFSFKTHWAFWGGADEEFYTKKETLSILKNVLDDYEIRMTESNMIMLRRMLDLVEEERRLDLQRMTFLNQHRNDD